MRVQFDFKAGIIGWTYFGLTKNICHEIQCVPKPVSYHLVRGHTSLLEGLQTKHFTIWNFISWLIQDSGNIIIDR